MAPMERSTRSRWRFEPQRDFANAEAHRLYQSFIWSIWMLLVALPPLLTTPIIAGQDSDISLSVFPVIGLAAGCLVIGIILARWMLKGFDLRERTTQAQAALMFAVPAVLFIASRLTESHDDQVTRASAAAVVAIAAFVAATFTGPNTAVIPVAGASALVVLLIPGIIPGQLIGISIWVCVMWFGLKMSIWYVDVVRDLDEARKNEGRLAVAEERLRFSTDLHDVMGRNLAAISLKAELADRLLDSNPSAARDQLGEVSGLAASSLADVRGLVRGYRGLDLDAEIGGAISLLESAGARVTLNGSADRLSPEQSAHTAALIREATTNILHHSDADHVTIDLAPASVQISNDRPHKRSVDGTAGGTGLDGLDRRIGDSGTISHRIENDHFILTLRFQEES